MRNILVINAGSTSLKYKFYSGEEERLSGIYEKLGQGSFRFKDYLNDESWEINEEEFDDAINRIGNKILGQESGVDSNEKQWGNNLNTIGFRVVHGGERFVAPTLLTEEVINEIDELSEIAPLHNPPVVERIREATDVFPDTPKYAVFDTEYHSTIPEKAYLYAIPYQYYRENKIRRYGFHGISHEYLVSEVNSKFKNQNLKIITCHLGGGASIAASINGKCVDTSMGFTPLEGLAMATRAGDVDDGVQNYLEEHLNLSEHEINEIFNKKSGLLGLSEFSSDMLELLDHYAKGDERAIRALEVYVYKIQKYIGAYIAAMNGLDVLVFSGGIGSGSDVIRKMVCDGLGNFGISINNEVNTGLVNVQNYTEIGNGDVKVVTFQTNEELMITRKINKIITC